MYARIHGAIHELIHPIEISIEMDDGEYIMYNHEYRLLVVTSDLNQGFKDIIDELEENWNDFVLQDETIMMKGALEFKKKFLSLVSMEL